MPIHDWTCVDASFFHSFHLSWIPAINGALNHGVLPSSHYAMCENQRDGRVPTFVEMPESSDDWIDPGDPGGIRWIDDGVPQTMFHDACTHPEYADNLITVRQCDCNQVVATIRIMTPQIKRSRYRLDQFVAWTVEVLREGVSVLVIDLFRPGGHDPQGIHKSIWDEFAASDFLLPNNMPLTIASYRAKPTIEAFVEPIAVGGELIDVPLFLDGRRYVAAPLSASYRKAFDGEPKCVRDMLTSGS